MAKLSKNAIIDYPAGIITGITYGLNPLFAKPLMNDGASTDAILFFRYGIAVILLGAYLLLKKENFKITFKQAGILLALGMLYTASSTFLFEAYKYIASGLATTLVFLFPVMVAIIMVFLKVVPSWPVWLSIGATFAGVMIMTGGTGSEVKGGNFSPARDVYITISVSCRQKMRYRPFLPRQSMNGSQARK